MPAEASKAQPARTPDKVTVPSNSSSTSWLAPLFGLLIILLTFAAYYPALQNGFIWDDDDLLMENPLIMGPLKDVWFSTKFFDYYPLTLTSLWAEWRMFGIKPGPYHFDNILLHAISAVIFWRVLLRLRVSGAWLVAAVFAIHPVTVESAAWIAERKNTMPMVFYALTFLFFLRSQPSSDQPGAGGYNKWYWFAVISFLLALLAKTSVVMLPFVLLGCIWWLNGRITRQDIVRTIPFFLLSFVLGLVTVRYQYQNAISTDVVQTAGFPEKLARAGWVVWFYLYKVLLPWPLYLCYPRWHVDPHQVLSYIPGVAVLIWMAVFWKFRDTWGKPVLFAFGYFVVTLFPVIGFFNIYFQKYSFVADHWQYISMISIVALIIGAAVHFLAKATKGRGAVAGFGAVVLAVCGVLTWQQCLTYKNEESLWRKTLKHNQASWLAHHNLGAALAQKADFLMQRNNMGAAEQVRRESMAELEHTLLLKPDHAFAHYNLADALMKGGDFDKAMDHLREAVKYDPDMVSALVLLAWDYATSKDSSKRNGAEAVRLAEHAVEVSKHQDVHALDTLAAAYAETERFEEAQKVAQEAVAVAYADHQDEIATEIERRMRQYKLYRPYRE